MKRGAGCAMEEWLAQSPGLPELREVNLLDAVIASG